MNIAIINCFETYSERISLVENYFKKNHNVTLIQSNFKHFKKEFIKESDIQNTAVIIPTMAYSKNLSIKRIVSHYLFAKNAFNEVEKLKPDLIYVVVPPNFLAKNAKHYKEKYPNTRIVFDYIDLWPETMPIGSFKNKFPFSYWKGLRSHSAVSANLIITECDLYQDMLKEELRNVEVSTLHLSKPVIAQNYKMLNSKNSIELCYLGSINNIIDIPKISEIIKDISVCKKVKVHIIGDGEKRDIFINSLKNSGAEVIFHGKIYDNEKKSEIFKNCHYGINIMKDTVCVGLTMKSLDYFQHSLPIINNIQGDTQEIVRKYNIGHNIFDDNYEKALSDIKTFSDEVHLSMKQKTERTFLKYFSTDSFNKNIDNIFSENKLF